MRIRELLDEGYGEATTEFGQHAATDVVKKTINTYRDLVNRNQVQGNERNIDWWRKQGWESFAAFVNSKSTQPSATQIKRRRAAGTSITLKETDQWLIVIPLDHEASCFHGRDTDWCTARPTGHYFDDYFLDQEVVLIYVINKTSGAKYAIASHPRIDRMELFDRNDTSITAEQFRAATGFDPAALVRLIPINDPRITHARSTRQALLSELKQRMSAWRRGSDHNRDAELEALLIKSKHAVSCVDYIHSVGERHGAQEFPEIISLAAVRSGDDDDDGSTIIWISNPSRVVMMAAVQQNGDAIEYIKNPSPEMQLAAVQQTGYAIRHIKNPTPEMQLAAVQQNGDAIEYIKNPSPEMQLAAVKQAGYAIRYIKNPTPEMQLAAVKQTGHAIRHIENPTPEMQLAAVQQTGPAIEYIKNPSPEMQLAAVQQTGYAIRHIKNPTPAIQLAAVRQTGDAIRYIKNPTPEAIELARTKGT